MWRPTPESDIDLAIFLGSNSSEEMHEKMIDVVVEHELDFAVTLSTIQSSYRNTSNGRTRYHIIRTLKKKEYSYGKRSDRTVKNVTQ